MAEFWIKKNYGVNFTRTEIDNVTDKGLRLYKYSPDRVLLQIRSKTAKQGQLANITLDNEQAKALANELHLLAELI